MKADIGGKAPVTRGTGEVQVGRRAASASSTSSAVEAPTRATARGGGVLLDQRAGAEVGTAMAYLGIIFPGKVGEGFPGSLDFLRGEGGPLSDRDSRGVMPSACVFAVTDRYCSVCRQGGFIKVAFVWNRDPTRHRPQRPTLVAGAAQMLR